MRGSDLLLYKKKKRGTLNAGIPREEKEKNGDILSSFCSKKREKERPIDPTAVGGEKRRNSFLMPSRERGWSKKKDDLF